MLFLFIILLLWILAGLAVLFWGTRTPRPGSARLVRTCDRWITDVHSQVTARLWLSGQGLASAEPDRKQFRVLQVLDQSSSMASGPGSPFERAVNAAASFIENVVSDNCQVGVIGFNDEARLIHPVSSAKKAVIGALEKIQPGGGTNIAAGLQQAALALNDLTTTGARPSNVVLLLSDGASDFELALQAAQVLKDRGVRLITIAFGAYADETLLRQIASSDQDYYETLDAAVLDQLYRVIGDSVSNLAGYRAVVEEKIASDSFLLSATGYPTSLESRCVAGEAKWFFPFVQKSARDIPYRITPMRSGWRRIARGSATVAMVDKGEQPVHAKSNGSPHVLVLPRGWWPGLGLLFNPLFWMLWDLLRRRTRPYELVPAPIRSKLLLPEAQPVRPTLKRAVEVALKPALIIGVGYAGSLVMRALRYHLTQLSPAPAGKLRFLWIDTGPSSQDDLAASALFGEPIPEDDTVLMPENLQPLFNSLRGAASVPERLAWLDAERTRRSLVAQDYDLSRGSLRRRVLGRLAFYQHLENGANSELSAKIDERLRDLGKHYRVFVVGHMGGGTASGVIIDLLAWLQKRIKQLEQDVASVDCLLLTHRTLDDRTVEPALLRNTIALATEISRQSIRRHLPLRLVQSPGEEDSPVEIKSLVDSLILLERPAETSSGRGQWPGPMTHSAAELLLHLLIDQNSSAGVFLEDQLSERRRLERASGHSIICTGGTSNRWLPVLEIRQFLTATTIRDFLAREFLRLERVGEKLMPTPDPEAKSVANENVAVLLQGKDLTRPSAALIGSLASLADVSLSPSELARIILRLNAYPGTQESISADIGGSQLISEVLDTQQELFAAAVEEWALDILRGHPQRGHQDNLALRRGAFPRLVAAVENLDALSEACLKNLEAQRVSAATCGSILRFEFVSYLFSRYRVVISGLRRQLATWLDLLVRIANHFDRQSAAMHQRLSSLHDQLAPYVVWSPEISDRMLANYAEPVCARLFEQVLWFSQFAKGASVRLNLSIQGKDRANFIGNTGEVVPICEALEKLVPELELDSGLDLYDEQIDRYVDLRRWLLADRIDPVDIDDNVQAELAGRPFIRHEIAWLSDHGGSVPEARMEVIPGSYPYRASVARITSGSALFAGSALGDYGRNFPNEPHVDLPFLDPVDRLAATYEDAFVPRGLTAPLLCPAIRAYFRDHEMLRAFAFAHAFDLVRLRLGVEREAVFINDIQLTHEKQEHDYPILLEALDNFVILQRATGGVGIDRKGILASVSAALAGRDSAALRAISLRLPEEIKPYLETCPPAVRVDFLHLAQLFLELEIQRRQEAAG
jgi:hypothetical protein